MPEVDVTETGKGLVDFLKRMEIEHVVYVDDAYDRGSDLEDAIAWMMIQNRVRIKNYFESFKVNEDPEDEELSVTLRSWFQKEENEEAAQDFLKKVFADRLRAKDHRAYDRQVMTRLDELLAGDKRFLPLRPSEWDEREEEILGWMEQGRLLLIFDDELGDHRKKGSVILEDLIKQGPNDRLLLGLLSYKIEEGKENEVTKAWKAKSSAIAVTGIAKEAIAGEQGEGELVLRIRAAVLWKESEALRVRVDSHLMDAIVAASQKVRDLTALDFDEAVFQASRVEGVHEADSLLRLYTSLVMAKLREDLRGDKDSLNDIAKLRAFSDINRKHKRPGSDAWKLQREELYESGTYVNVCHMPTDVGDVYRLTSPSTEANKPGKVGEYVLVAPPCDVAIRTEGTRKAWTGVLCPITLNEPDSGMRLDFFDGDTGETRWVNVAKWIPVPLWILDLCATNERGRSVFDTTADAPGILSEGWKLRHSNLCSYTTKMLGQHLKASEAEYGEEGSPKPVSSSYELDDELSIIFGCEEEKISFGVERRLRLSPLLARELVETYSRYVSRPARPHALTLELRTEVKKGTV